MGLWRYLVPGLAAGLLLRAWRSRPGPMAAAPPKTRPNPSTGPAMNPPSVYTTPLAAAVPKAGFVSWQGMVITPLPLLDVETGLFARLRYRDAVKVAQGYGARLLSVEEADKLFAESPFKLAPCILPPTAMMASREWAEKHDACVREQLERLNWDGHTPVANVGKHWIRGAAAGRALNYGWHDSKAPNGRIWQSLGTRHDDAHTDYSQLTYLVKEIAR